MRRLEADAHAEGLAALFGRLQEIEPPGAVSPRAVRILAGILGDALVLGRFVRGLPRPAGPLVE